MLNIVEEDEDDAEELCNCQFTLAYGTKLLLHNTKMKLKRGKRHDLLGPNNSTALGVSLAQPNNSTALEVLLAQTGTNKLDNNNGSACYDFSI